MKKALISIGIAMAAGAILGVLYAPDKGERTRRRIIRKGRSISRTIDCELAEAKSELEELKDNLEEQLACVKERLTTASNI